MILSSGMTFSDLPRRRPSLLRCRHCAKRAFNFRSYSISHFTDGHASDIKTRFNFDINSSFSSTEQKVKQFT